MDGFDRAYRSGDRQTAKVSADLLIGDVVIIQQVWSMANVHRQTAQSTVFVYQFEHQSAFLPQPTHTAEVPFVFGTLQRSRQARKVHPSLSDQTMSQTTIAFWTRFASTGDPNVQQLSEWPVYKGAGSAVMRFRIPIAAAAETGTERFALIESCRCAGRLPEAWRSKKGRVPEPAARVRARLAVPIVSFATRLRSARSS